MRLTSAKAVAPVRFMTRLAGEAMCTGRRNASEVDQASECSKLLEGHQ